LDTLQETLSEFEITTIILPDGEKYKTLEQVAVIYDELLNSRFERSGTLIALGGGVIGDMTGFAAATYQRGVNFIQVPTTLLSQVDSSVGGKTGVNRPLGKNMVGAFYQPQCVIADTDTLNTLPDRELLAGLAEVIKYGLINNARFYEWLKANSRSIVGRDAQALAYAIRVSCEEKAQIVSKDEKESGIRAILNLGHTFAHAIEASMGYGNWLHGEAVATGMVMAADLSMRLGMLPGQQAQDIKKLISDTGLPVVPPSRMQPQDYLELMSRDKKADRGVVRFVLLEKTGKAIVRGDIDETALLQTLAAGSELTNCSEVA
ncbi:MAG: 3-dehydroquinate synthase, partial [Pseudohongiellaceae bacterium]